ncbi:uncharacterized protein LOC112347425 [Selaginella moellendorffii]|uniref:uncharacterized protein LOC112347425 n=1 Tax=Selaginella moellendorffii TaxID=88036 RepID=UPI000D1C2D13|nr:uncharacterized protein LOC112347425 [Selaginella moellendorffii]|eukprot:XP_024533987.1 uncharacterized protein LOC112347425 [Selaginella moellendorffii]
MHRTRLLLVSTMLLIAITFSKGFAAAQARSPSLADPSSGIQFSAKAIRRPRMRSLLSDREMRIEEEDYYMVDPPPRPRTPVKSGPIKYVDPALEKPRIPRRTRTRQNIPRNRSVPPTPSPVCPSPPCRSWPSARSPP